MRKSTLKAAAALISLLVGSFAAVAADVPVKAQAPSLIPPISGYISLYGGGTRTSGDIASSFSDTTLLYGGNGRVNVWFTPGMSAQLDVEGEGTGSFDFVSDFSLGGRLGGVFGGHLTWRDPHSYAVGVFGSVTGANDPFGGTSTHGVIGVEGQRYLGNATLYGQAGYIARIGTPSSGAVEVAPQWGWLARAQGRYFFTPNDKLSAEIGFTRLSHDLEPGDSGKLNVVNWGLAYEHRFASSPWSAFVEYAGFRNRPSGWPESSNGNRMTEHMVLLGVRAHLGDASLLAQDRTGATLDMPKVSRALSWTCLLVCNP